MGSFWDREPVLFMTVIQSGLGLAVAFGVGLTAEQTAAILTFSAGVLGLIVRAKVSPTITK